jgi:hypothetical protein
MIWPNYINTSLELFSFPMLFTINRIIYMRFYIKVTHSLSKVTKKADSDDNPKKTFKVEISKGLSKDIDKLENDLDISHSGFLHLATDFLHGYSKFWQKRFDQVDEVGIYLDKALGLYKYSREPKDPSEKALGKVFLLGLWLSEIPEEKKDEYVSLLLTEGLTAKQIFAMLTEEEERI